ncbi:putative histone acetyltransferase spt10 protein [Phaeoacremonium minimum UCRPA7]|uniref:Putative histone acetyltransferase spt10 protein n=1 Tax=Phaeoacremonium minimum (strain UCR-PA7) TaxID=1286976 RepID=R8BDG3_PHAM7|nr:putative histone acetyltransferase spt10 protein [Phaeoacremonium minimum UCRPA7]EON97332.1 putative histone acetyltransferase spt10 protein [Phaeoacremonium minimum UCRPA7]
MPAIMDDPDSPTIYRVSGEPPYPDPNTPALPANILPRQVTLRDRQTVATVVPFASRHQVPLSLVNYLADQFAKEIEGGDTYPMIEPMSRERFASYWFQNFGAIMLLGSIDSPADVVEGKDWSKECLGSFYIKPNYPGRSSHVCNAGFLVTDASRNRGVGRLMGESYLDYAPKLGYTYSVFNLVYETNVASCKIWDALGFKRIGRVKGCGNLKSYPGRLIDAIIYGRDLVLGESDELVSEERFDKIKFYLKYGKYPKGADRAEKSRLRSATTHYKLIDGDKLMLKDKEVISDPQQQYEISRQVHMQQHGGINKTTATITEKYHWSRIKETVSDHLPHNHDPHHRTAEEEEADREAVDRDLDMLIEPQDDDDEPPDMDIDIGVGGNHDDLSKMSVTHLLSAPEADGAASKDPETPKTRDMFDVEYSAPG